MDQSLVMGQGVQASANSVSGDSPAGIHCANPDCRTRAGERSRGHQSCRSLLCGHCCQQASKQAAEKGEHRAVCKVHSRRVHTGHRPLPKDSPQHPTHQQHDSLSSASTSMPNGWTPSEESPELHELLEKRAQLERSLKRSLTLVFWYRNGCEPLRLPHEVSTFPYFRLLDFPELVGELALQPNAYVDCYNAETGQWEQHKIGTVRNVEEGQRLLYRLRPSLLDSLTDCPQLDQELSLQPHKAHSGIKRALEPYSPPISNKHPRILSNAVPVRPPTSVPLTPGQPNKVLSTTVSNDGQQQQQQQQQPPPPPPPPQHQPSWIPSGENSPAPSASGSNSNAASSWGFVPTGTMPTINRNSHSRAPEPPTTPGVAPPTGHAAKKWPTDFFVYEITDGFAAMTNIMTSDPRERQKSAFEKVFGCRYVKSTVGRAKLYWKRASQEIKDHFLHLPRQDPRGKWQNFVHLMDGRLIIEIGKEGEAGGEDDEKDSGDERHPPPVNSTPTLSFENPPMPPAHLNVRPSDDVPHPGLPMVRPPGQSELLGHPGPGRMVHPSDRVLSHHLPQGGPLPMPQSYASDRGMGMNRSSSSLSGAMTIAPT